VNYLLDTCIISQFVRGNPGVVARIKGAPPRRIHVSTITCMELKYGLRLNPKRAIELRPVLDALLNTANILDYDREDALATAAIRATLKALGTPISPYDLMLAGCALRRGLTFVTDNVDEFKRVDGLTTENWISRS